MCEELAEEQLKEFCSRHGLAKDGYLDETELTSVCQCIGLQVSSEMIKELFEELDGDKDGRVCLSELSQMLRGMQDKLPPSPEKIGKIKNDVTNSPPSRPVGKGTNGFSSIPVNERGAYSILDPENTGFAKVGRILDLWLQLGIGESDGARLLSELGFPSNSKSHSVNLQDLAKSVEDEIDHSKERLPLAFQVALVTYRTEAQFMKTLCESIECEKDKLKADIVDAHQQTALIAQEVDEQNARLERNSQMLIRKMEVKYNEQIQEIQDRFSTEKEALQQTYNAAETKLRELQEEDTKLKTQINKLHEENTNLEKELHNLTAEITNVNRTRSQLEREVSRFIGLETQLQEMERKYVESLTNNDSKLKDTYSEMQTLRDQNDELSMQLESLREKLRNIEATQTKEKRYKKRKGHHNHSCSKSTSSPCSSLVVCNPEGGRQCPLDGEDVPVNKMGKYYCRHEGRRSMEDGEECDSSLEQTISAPTSITSCSSSNNNLDHIISGTGRSPSTALQSPHQPISIRLAACIGESSTDPVLGNDEEVDEEMESEPSISAIEERLMMGQTERDCASLESEMCAVAKAHSRNSDHHEHSLNNSSVCRQFITGASNSCGKVFLRKQAKMVDKSDQVGPSFCSSQEIGIQTVDSSPNADAKTIEQLQGQVSQFGNEMSKIKAAYEKEKSELKAQCSDLDNSLQMLKEEYEKTEDYWHDKLQEARDFYEQDKIEADDRLQDLMNKIREYDELVLASGGCNNGYDRLPPIEERASLEKQVTDLEEECEVLRNELKSVRMEQESVITSCQRSFETKLREECANLEQQVSALSKKCQEYESRISALAEEERSTVEKNGMMDLMKERIKQLEMQLRSQEDKYRQQINLLEATLKERETLYKKSIPDLAKPLSPQFGQNNWNNEIVSQSKSKSLLEMLHNSQKPEAVWPQRFASVADKSSSLPFIPAVDAAYALQPSAWGSLSPPFQPDHASSWGVPPSGGPMPTMKKAWCHVELGWLQSLRAKLKQRDEQCYLLQRALQQKDTQTEKIATELKYQHEVEIANWESLMQASQELLRQHVMKHKEQAEKLAHSDLLMKDLWVENAKLMAALNATEQRVIQLENLLKFQMTSVNSHSHHHHTYSYHSSPSSPHHHGSSHNNNNNNLSPQTNAISSNAPLSLPHQSSHFNI